MDNKILPLSLAVFLFGSIIGLAVMARQETAGTDKNEQKTLDTDPKLTGWWKFDEASGRTAADSSGHDRNGTLKEDLSFDKDSAQGRTGRALKFGDDDGHVEITKYKGITGTHARTVAAWIKTKSSEGQIISWGTEDYGKMWIFGFIRGRIGVTPSGGYLYMKDETNDDKWHHVAVVVEEAELPNLYDNVKLYKDGVPAVIHDIGLLDLWPIDTGDELDVRIGLGFEGLIDDVRIYERALSEQEILALFKLQSDRPLAKSEK
jgi:hypothetical protein